MPRVSQTLTTNRSAFIALQKRELPGATPFELAMMWRLHKARETGDHKRRAETQSNEKAAAISSNSSGGGGSDFAVTDEAAGERCVTKTATSDADISLAQCTITAPAESSEELQEEEALALVAVLMREPTTKKRKSPPDGSSAAAVDGATQEFTTLTQQQEVASATPKKKRKKRAPKSIGQALLSPAERRKIQCKFTRRQRRARARYFPAGSPPKLKVAAEQILCVTDDSDSGEGGKPTQRWALVKIMRFDDPDKPLPQWMPLTEAEAKYPELVQQHMKSPLCSGLRQYALWAGVL